MFVQKKSILNNFYIWSQETFYQMKEYTSFNTESYSEKGKGEKKKKTFCFWEGKEF